MQIKLGFSLQDKGCLKNPIRNRAPQKTAKNTLMKEEKKKRKSLFFLNWKKRWRKRLLFLRFTQNKPFLSLAGGGGAGVHLQPRESGGEVGWNKCYTGDADCVFPMVHYPFTHSPHPNPENPPPFALTRKDRVRLSFSPQGRGILTELIQMKKFNTIDGLPPPK